MVDKVGLVYTKEYQKYNFGKDHPMRPVRIELTYSLMDKLSLLKNERLEILHPRIATRGELERVHSPNYIDAVEKSHVKRGLSIEALSIFSKDP